MAIIPHTSMNNLAEQIAEALRGLSGTSDHEELSGLLGGSAKNHYHLTSEEVSKLQNIPTEGVRGEKGERGDPGAAATIEIGTVTTGAAGTQARVVNVGTPNAARLNFTIPRGDKGERGDTGDTAEGAITDHERLNNLLGGRANEHYHLTLAEKEKLQSMSSGVGKNYRLVKKMFAGAVTATTERKDPNYSDANVMNKMTVPEGVDVVYISGCGGGGGLAYDNVRGLFYSGWTGGQCINMGFSVKEGDEIAVYSGSGGVGVNVISYTSFQSSIGNNVRGEDSIVYLNGKEILRLSGGDSKGNHAGNQTGESKVDDNVRLPLSGKIIYANCEDGAFLDYSYFPKLDILNDDIYSYILAINSGIKSPEGFFSPYGVGGVISRSGLNVNMSKNDGGPGLILIEYVEPIGS